MGRKTKEASKGHETKTKASCGNASNQQPPPKVLLHNPGSGDTQPSTSSPSNDTNIADDHQSSLSMAVRLLLSSLIPDNNKPNNAHLRPPSQGSFHNDAHGNVIQAQQVHMDSPTLNEFRGDQIVYNIGNTDPLGRLAEHTMLDATHDSSARDPPPRCHPGTRQNILRLIQERLSDHQEVAKLLLWLQGPAGVGKSAIMQTIAETAAEDNTLGASVFFSKSNNLDNPQKTLNTIAYQLAVNNHSYQQYLIQRIAADPAIVKKVMEKQFNDFFVVPFAQQQLLHGHYGLIILIDGLDECKGSREQRKIVKLIYDFVSKYPTIPLRWIIASRPEEHLIDTFSHIRTVLHAYWELEVPIDSDDGVRDVEHYLDEEFTRIRNDYHRLMPVDRRWPSEKHFLVISSAASGLFIFASTVIRFIDDDENPVFRLNIVISILEKRETRRNLQINPLALLDALYERILSEMSSDTMVAAKLILGQLMVGYYIPSYSARMPFYVCNVLGLEQYAMYGALRKLRSVLSFPALERADDVEIRFLHASFSDYLRDETRSHVYSVNLDQATTFLWHRYMTILQQWMRTRSCIGIELSWSVEEPKESGRARTEVSKRLRFDAGTWWPYLLLRALEYGQTTAFRLLISSEDVIRQLRQLDYSYREVLDGTTVDSTYHLIRCLKAQIPIYLSKDIIQNLHITSLDKNCVLKSLDKRRWIGGTTYFSFYSDTFEFRDLEEIEEFLRDRVEMARAVLDLMESANTLEVKVTILGEQPTKCRVLLQDCSGNPLYCFPYMV